MRKTPKYFIPNIITLANMFLGFLAIALIINEKPLNAGVVILFAGMLDVFDGKIARMLGITSRFGAEFDSMADTISFCAAPSILIYHMYVDGLHPFLGLIISFMPLMFGTIRLAKYNVEKNIIDKNKYTYGLTTPVAAITLFSYLYFNYQIDGSYGDPRTALMLVAATSILMISPIHFAKFPVLSFKYGRSNSILLIIFILSTLGIIWQSGLFLFPVTLLFIGWNIMHWLLHPQKDNLHTKINR